MLKFGKVKHKNVKTMQAKEEEFITGEEVLKLIDKKSPTSLKRFWESNKEIVNRYNPTRPGCAGPGHNYVYLKAEVLQAIRKSIVVI
jgi:hypothetical protein